MLALLVKANLDVAQFFAILAAIFFALIVLFSMPARRGDGFLGWAFTALGLICVSLCLVFTI